MTNSTLRIMYDKFDMAKLNYTVPDSEKFRKLNLKKIKWPTAKGKNFYYILKELALNGPMTLSKLVDHYPDSKKSTKGVLHRVLNTYKEFDNNLESYGFISKDKKYQLTTIGLLFVIDLFDCGKYYDSKNNSESKNVDFSYQKDLIGILDILKKNYNYFPLIFNNLDYIKNHKDLDVNVIFKILTKNNSLLFENLFLYYKDDKLDFNTQLENIVSFMFFFVNGGNVLINECGHIYIDKNITDDLIFTCRNIFDKFDFEHESFFKLVLMMCGLKS